MSSEKVGQLHVLQQNMQNLLVQKQQLESQMMELDSALAELQDTKQAYKIVGKIMFSSSKEELQKSLSEKKEVLQVRLNAFEKQEKKLHENFEKLQQEVVGQLKEGKR